MPVPPEEAAIRVEAAMPVPCEGTAWPVPPEEAAIRVEAAMPVPCERTAWPVPPEETAIPVEAAMPVPCEGAAWPVPPEEAAICHLLAFWHSVRTGSLQKRPPSTLLGIDDILVSCVYGCSLPRLRAHKIPPLAAGIPVPETLFPH